MWYVYHIFSQQDFSLIKNRVPHGAGLLWPPGYTFYSRSWASTYKSWVVQVGWFVLWLNRVYLETREWNPHFWSEKNPITPFYHWNPKTRNLQIPGFWAPEKALRLKTFDVDARDSQRIIKTLTNSLLPGPEGHGSHVSSVLAPQFLNV